MLQRQRRHVGEHAVDAPAEHAGEVRAGRSPPTAGRPGPPHGNAGCTAARARSGPAGGSPPPRATPRTATACTAGRCRACPAGIVGVQLLHPLQRVVVEGRQHHPVGEPELGDRGQHLLLQPGIGLDRVLQLDVQRQPRRRHQARAPRRGSGCGRRRNRPCPADASSSPQLVEACNPTTGPVPSVVRSTVSSWITTTVPSAVSWTSNSTPSAPCRSRARRRAGCSRAPRGGHPGAPRSGSCHLLGRDVVGSQAIVTVRRPNRHRRHRRRLHRPLRRARPARRHRDGHPRPRPPDDRLLPRRPRRARRTRPATPSPSWRRPTPRDDVDRVTVAAMTDRLRLWRSNCTRPASSWPT